MVERLDPWHWPADHERDFHVQRYLWALRRLDLAVKEWTIADAACGTGWGTYLLRQWTKCQVVGYDYSPEALEVARQRYPGEYRLVDLNQESVKANIVVSFETIEHLEDPERFLGTLECNELILSTPVIPSKHMNPFHKHDFTPDEILSMFEKHFHIYESKEQTYHAEMYGQPAGTPLYLLLAGVRK